MNGGRLRPITGGGWGASVAVAVAVTVAVAVAVAVAVLALALATGSTVTVEAGCSFVHAAAARPIAAKYRARIRVVIIGPD